MRSYGLGLMVILILSGCAHSVHQSHTSDFRGMQTNAKQIEAEATQFVVLGFVFDTNYVDTAFPKLQRQCPQRITGITTRYSTSLGFFSWTNKVKMTGYCESSGAT